MKRILWLVAYIGIVWYFGGAQAVGIRLAIGLAGALLFTLVYARKKNIGTPVPSLSLTERALDDSQRERA
jgi:hypothetical protein